MWDFSTCTIPGFCDPASGDIKSRVISINLAVDHFTFGATVAAIANNASPRTLLYNSARAPTATSEPGPQQCAACRLSSRRSGIVHSSVESTLTARSPRPSKPIYHVL